MENEEIYKEFPPYDVENLTKEEILGDTVINYLVGMEDYAEQIRAIELVKDKAKRLRVLTPFKKIIDSRLKSNKPVSNENEIKGIIFPEMDNILYKVNKFTMDDSGTIYEVIPDIGRMLVCYHPILPVQTYTNLEDGSTKVKLAFYKRNKWNYIIVDKSIISSSQAIVKLADSDIEVTSETAKHLVKYLSEIENLNRDIIPNSVSVSRLGWFEGELIPYSKKFEIDNVKDIPNLDSMFNTEGELSDWVEFFKERRKYNVVSRLIMASAVVSILLDKIGQPGYTLHVWGESEYGKTVACMVGESMFGNPSQDSKGFGINFNFTINGLESVLNKYNNLPLFVNEMQHQKDVKDYDKMLFLISEGKGKSRSTKNIGVARQNSWHNVVITNGEKNIIKDNSNAGAFNRCFSFELKDYSFEDLAEVADFAKENYGTPIREILKNLDNFNPKKIYKEELSKLDQEDTSNKQKIIEALILTGDRIVTDILFKDKFYIKHEDLDDSIVKKSEIAIETRALEVIQDWVASESRHFWNKVDDKSDENKYKVEIYGRELEYNRVAFIPTILKNKLNDNGFDPNETINAWKRKGIIECQDGRAAKNVRIDDKPVRCIVLKFKQLEVAQDEFEEIPF